MTDLLKGRGKASGLLCGCQVREKTSVNGNGHHHASSDLHGQSLTDSPVDMSPSIDHLSTSPTAPNSGYCVDHDDEEEDDDGDGWLASLEPCSKPGVVPKHVHIKVAVEEKKRKFF